MSDGMCKRWIREQKKERWVVQGVDQGVIKEAMGGTSDGPGSYRRRDG
jgi:hypothetical protein